MTFSKPKDNFRLKCTLPEISVVFWWLGTRRNARLVLQFRCSLTGHTVRQRKRDVTSAQTSKVWGSSSAKNMVSHALNYVNNYVAPDKKNKTKKPKTLVVQSLITKATNLGEHTECWWAMALAEGTPYRPLRCEEWLWKWSDKHTGQMVQRHTFLGAHS